MDHGHEEDHYINKKTKEAMDTKPPIVVSYENYLADLARLRLNQKLTNDKSSKKQEHPSIRKSTSWKEDPLKGLAFPLIRSPSVKGSKFTPGSNFSERHLRQMYIGGFDTKLGNELAEFSKRPYVNIEALSDFSNAKYPLHSRKLFTDLDVCPKIVAVIADSDILTPANIFSSRTKAAVFTDWIQKLSSSCKILMLHQAMMSPWINLLDSPPAAKVIYAKHPKVNRFLNVRNFHKNLMHEKANELNHILHHLGAKSVTWKTHWHWNRQYNFPVDVNPYLVTEPDLMYYESEPQWKAVVDDVSQYS